MTRFLLSRGLLLVLGLAVASVLIFLALRFLPGDVAQVIAGTDATPARIAAIRESLGLDRPLPVQYFEWVGGLLRGDLGNSVVTGTPVASEIAEKAQVTLPLALLSMLIGLAIAGPLGVAAALRRGRPAGFVLSGSAQALAAVPVIWAGMLLVIVFSLWLGWLPAQGFPRAGWSDPGAALRSLLLPAITIGIIEGAALLRFVRSATLGVMGQDFIRTAAAAGRTRTGALLTHGLPSVALSIVSVLGIQVAGLLVGTVLVENLFTLPGIGRMLVADVGNRDLTKVQSEVLVLTAIVLIIGTLVDVIHRLVDPRAREVTA
ncbi:ABC transporter permease [Mycetocola tolaasinivorans]|uniref:ABC transporter permease n=1 Tax=Mycetocola tolaasinivorans TaxID=76635 RepID=A0A3L6ZZG4_9MICO|nr:ABC transporter permease [Mycetocola tolaasinivorans]RLP73327.1 ABC transporter permease [Mycetocola tolaasinivorans]